MVEKQEIKTRIFLFAAIIVLAGAIIVVIIEFGPSSAEELADRYFAPTGTSPPITASPTITSSPAPTFLTYFPPKPTITRSPTPITPTSTTPTSTPAPTLTPTPRPTAVMHTYSVGEAIKLTSIHMISETEGWGLHESSVFVTKDGGYNWQDVTPPGRVVEGTSYATYGGFSDANHAWVVFATGFHSQPDTTWVETDASVWYTTDGGQTWDASQPLMNHLSYRVYINMIDTQTGWLRMQWGYVGAGHHDETVLFLTTDGGVDWNVINYRLLWVGDMDFLTDKIGWMLYRHAECSACEPGPPSYYKSTDGGLTWDQYSLPLPQDPPNLLEEFWYCDPYQLNLLTEKIVRLKVACSKFWDHDNPEPIDYIYASEDGGSTWNIYKLPESTAAFEEYYSNMIFFDADHSLLLSKEIWRTTDGGKTWQKINTVTWESHEFSFVDSLRGWAVTGQDLMYTSDGGRSWQKINPVIGP